MILIAEDNESMRRMIRSLIEDIDPEIVECCDGGEAIDAYETNKPGFVLMDISMLPIDGLTASKEILRRDPLAKIIVVTQLQDAHTRDAAMKLGAFGFVGKDNLMSLRKLLAEKPEKGQAGIG